MADDEYETTPLNESYSDEDDGNTHSRTYKVQEIVEMIGIGKFQYRVFALLNIIQASDAMEIMLLSILGPILQCEWNLYNWQKALLTTAVFCGELPASSLWGIMSDKFGRKPALFCCASWILYFGVLSSFSPTFYFLLLLRLLVGAGVGGGHNTTILLVEFVPIKRRAQVLGILSTIWTIGTVVEIVLAILVIPTLGWRWWVSLSGLPLVIYIISSKWMPESPSYLACSGREDEAMELLQDAANCNGKKLPENLKLQPEIDVKRGHFQDLFNQDYRLTTILVWFLFFTMNFAYYGVVLMSSEFLRNGDDYCSVGALNSSLDCPLECKKLDEDDYITMLIFTLAEVVAVIILLSIVDYIGRKPTIIVFLIMFSFFTAFIGTCAYHSVLFISMFGARLAVSGLGKVSFLYASEVYPTSFRSLGVGAASAASRVGALLTPFVAQVLLDYSVYSALGVYSGISLLTVIAVVYLPYETKGNKLA